MSQPVCLDKHPIFENGKYVNDDTEMLLSQSSAKALVLNITDTCWHDAPRPPKYNSLYISMFLLSPADSERELNIP